jgi:dTDP-4-amino-4,6-dideoxygalactose transaminase
MNCLERRKLIPRNNWDFGFKALGTALAGLPSPSGQALNTGRIFQQDAVWTNSGRASLYAILKSLELPAGAKVGVPLFCCSVVFNAIHRAGFTPCFIDSDISDGNMSVEDLRKKRNDLAAVVVVHMFGKPCAMDAILDAASNLPVIEDCAQSLFSTYKGKLTGLLSTASFFSFRCGKYISAGEGSAILCQDPELRRKIQQTVAGFASWSTPKMFIDAFLTLVKASLYKRPWYGLLGYPVGMRLDKKLNLTAKEGFEPLKIAPTYLALIDARVAHFQEKINIQREHAKTLLKAVAPGDFALPAEDPDGRSNWFQFALRFSNARQRDAMADYLFARGIDTSKYLDGIADETRSNYGYAGDCPNAEQLSKTILLVPIYYTLHNVDIEYIIQTINESTSILRLKDTNLE